MQVKWQKRYVGELLEHKAQALMGATRLASGIVQLLFTGACILFYHFPDARRVAPIRGSV